MEKMTEQEIGQIGEAVQKKKHGCLFWGCLTVIIVGLLIAGIASFAGYKIYKKTLSFTSEEPVSISVYKPSQKEYESVRARVDAFRKALDEDREAELVLTAADINTLISLDPELKELAGKVYVYIEGGQIRADASIPLNQIPGFSGRYLNGTVGLKISLENGVLIIHAENVIVDGEPLPEKFMEELRKVNLAKDAYEDVETAELIKKFKSIRIEGGKLIISKY